MGSSAKVKCRAEADGHSPRHAVDSTIPPSLTGVQVPMSLRSSRKSLLAALAFTLGTPIVAAAQNGLPVIPNPLKVVDIRWIDTTANACTDFFQYANGAWLAHDTIPAAYSSSGVARDMSDI